MMMQTPKIEKVKDLSPAGFDLRPHGWGLDIESQTGHRFTLYIADDSGGTDIYGTVGRSDQSSEALNFDTWIFRLAFCDSAAAKRVKTIIDQLVAEGRLIIKEGGLNK